MNSHACLWLTRCWRFPFLPAIGHSLSPVCPARFGTTAGLACVCPAITRVIARKASRHRERRPRPAVLVARPGARQTTPLSTCSHIGVPRSHMGPVHALTLDVGALITQKRSTIGAPGSWGQSKTGRRQGDLASAGIDEVKIMGSKNNPKNRGVANDEKFFRRQEGEAGSLCRLQRRPWPLHRGAGRERQDDHGSGRPSVAVARDLRPDPPRRRLPMLAEPRPQSR